ncbi:MAG TPA: hypothetical protein PKK74_00850 [Candidatus Methanoculleus thermohydrogenotrophicum]|nr:hypothetical protein [Candidatus Methanoculleus thermohydrogenotrophicum]NLM82793.1 hypothetical protein [Candidatus Methanoculleus thermohydrogenotrophicum]HOB17233.1 hypothetical protein [Candidatus Methanoculleus thermohydrogenotrophicum]HQC92146.1 hypothetical protein [Candidatus Methanoculleus thermohydrogenotrophicum]
MKSIACRGGGVLAAGLCLLLVFTAGCLVPEYGVGRDILVFKVDAGGRSSGRRPSIPEAMIRQRA